MIIFSGDINLTDNAFDVGYGVGSRLSQGLDPFVGIKKNRNDCWVGNFEGVASDTTQLTTYLKNCFRVKEESISNLGLIDYYGVANNHVMEHGPIAYQNTIRALQHSGSEIFGSLSQKYIKFEHEGKSVCILGFSQRYDHHAFEPQYWNHPEYIDIVKEYMQIKDCDYKIAYLHWGTEFIPYPSAELKLFAHWLIDIGFDLIIGMHPHVLQGYEIYKGKYIFYSLGNFVFNMTWERARYGAIVSLNVITGTIGYDYIYINNKYFPEIIVEEQVPSNMRFTFLNTLLYKNDNIEEYYQTFQKYLNQYRRASRSDIIRNLYRSDIAFTFSIFKDFVSRKIKNNNAYCL